MQNTHYLELLFVHLNMSYKSHWERIYKEKSPQEVSWTEEIPDTSIDFFKDFNWLNFFEHKLLFKDELSFTYLKILSLLNLNFVLVKSFRYKSLAL